MAGAAGSTTPCAEPDTSMATPMTAGVGPATTPAAGLLAETHSEDAEETTSKAAKAMEAEVMGAAAKAALPEAMTA